jgi:NitT/TauT family transport system permease protein
MKRFGPILITLVVLIALGYPLAFLFGIPLARKDFRDLRKWQKEIITAQAPRDVSSPSSLPFESIPKSGILIDNNQPIASDYTVNGNTISPTKAPDTLVNWGPTLEPLSLRYGNAYTFGETIADVDPNRTLYNDNILLNEGSAAPVELPDGTLRTFTFNNPVKAILVDDQIFISEEGLLDLIDSSNYKQNGQRFTLNTTPPFGSNVRALTGDYAILDASKGIIATAAEAYKGLRATSSVLRLAETLQGAVDGKNTLFRFARDRVVEADKERSVFLDSQRLSDTAERPKERVDGVQTTFTFTSAKGLVVVDSALLEETKDYTRKGSSITFNQTPQRNAELRQYPDYFLSDPARGEILLAIPPATGSKLWTSQYAVYAQPACGKNLLQCFYALPQHPMPFPHWIVGRIPAFFGKFPLSDERNVVRAMLYTTLGTLLSLILGGVIGSLLAMLFVMIRPLERALLPWTIASQTIPIIALVPVMLLVLGNFGITIQTSLLPTAIIGAYICFFPVVVSTVKGLRSVDPLILDLMKSYAATPLQVFRNVRFPAAVPFVFTGLKLGTAAALVGALVAETESNNKRGLGFQILGQVQTGNVADVWILLLISALLGISLVSLVGFLQRIVAPWERK